MICVCYYSSYRCTLPSFLENKLRKLFRITANAWQNANYKLRATRHVQYVKLPSVNLLFVCTLCKSSSARTPTENRSFASLNRSFASLNNSSSSFADLSPKRSLLHMHAPSDTARSTSSWSLRIPAVAPFACERPRALNAVECFSLRTLAGLVWRRSFGPIVTVAHSHRGGCAGQKVAFPKSTTTNDLFRKTSLFGCVRCLRCTKIGATSSMHVRT